MSKFKKKHVWIMTRNNKVFRCYHCKGCDSSFTIISDRGSVKNKMKAAMEEKGIDSSCRLQQIKQVMDI